ncbi:MAG: glycosyltransferase [Thermodesulfobacteriota bacterium]
MKVYIDSAILLFNELVLAYYAVANAIYAVLLVAAVWLILRHLMRRGYSRYHESIHPSMVQPISVLLSAYNEESNIVESVKSLCQLNYPDYEIVVINDGSTDATFRRLVESFGLRRIKSVYRPILRTAGVRGFYASRRVPNLVVIDKEHSGKADSLNTGINASRAPYFCSVDADSILEKDSLMRLMWPIIEEPEVVKATGGIVRIVNGSVVRDGKIAEVRLPEDSLSRLQVVEYIRSFLFGRAGLSALNSLLIISGTFSMFHKKSVIAVGGYSTDTVTEDMELVVRLHRYFMRTKQKYRINFVPDPICWTEAPKTFAALSKQRKRWHAGLGESIALHMAMVFNPRYGRIGLFAMPYQLLIEFFGPFIETAGYAVVVLSFMAGIIDVRFFMLFLVMAVAIGVFFSTVAILLEEITYRRYPRLRDLLVLLFYGVLENFGYRQVVAYWRTRAIISFILPGKKRWEHIKKHGFDYKPLNKT